MSSNREVHNRDGSIEYLDENGSQHRDDGPAYISSNGAVWYYRHGDCHRESGPAVITDKGKEFFYLCGVHLSEKKFKKITQGPVENLPLYLGLGIDKYIAERLVSEHD